MAVKICRRSAWRTNGRIAPDETSHNRVTPWIWCLSTFSDGEEAVRWVSGQASWLAAMAAKSTGGNRPSMGCSGPAAAVVASDPEGAFTLAGVTAAVPGPGGETDGLDKTSATKLSVPLMCLMSLENSAT
jgi:hypothetical protein